ncbi:Protein CBG12847 [Trichuris trichiura]|uniref:Protein CBG12847 n=1 Tax=Trichuris trichiura TaxID=36087 RepID=A0A077ZIQ7_TRITR|nr:Protein CBG12847 [Trichuris trichiura]
MDPSPFVEQSKKVDSTHCPKSRYASSFFFIVLLPYQFWPPPPPSSSVKGRVPTRALLFCLYLLQSALDILSSSCGSNYGYGLKRPYYGFGDSSRLTGADWHKDYSHVDYGRSSPAARRVSGSYAAGTDNDWVRPIRTHYSMGSLAATPSSSPSTYRRHMNSSFDSFRETPARYSSSSTYGGDSPFRKSSYSSYTPLTSSRMGLGYSSLSGSQSWLTPSRVIPSMSSSYSGSTSLRRELPNRRMSSSTELTASGNFPTYSQTLDTSRHMSSESSVNSTSAIAAGRSANADDEAMDGEEEKKDSKSTLSAVQPREVDSASESGDESLSSSDLPEQPKGGKDTERQSPSEHPASSESASSEKDNNEDKTKEDEDDDDDDEEEEYHFDRNIGIQLVSVNSKEDSTEELNFGPSSSLTDQLPAWQQFCGYDDDEEEEEEEEKAPVDEADNDNREVDQKVVSSNDAADSSNQFYHLCMVEPDESSAGSPEQQRKAEPWEQFCDYGYTDNSEPDEDDAQVQNQASSTNNAWQQFCDYSSDEAEAEEDEEEEEEEAGKGEETVAIPKIDIQLANDQDDVAKDVKLPPEPKKLAVDSLYNSSESEETSDEDVPTLNRRVSAVQILSVSPSGSSYGGFSSSDYDSDYDTSTLSRDSRLPMFMVQKEPPEERGRVQPHLAQPAPVFSVTLDYSDLSDEDEEEEVDSVSDYEDLSDHLVDQADQQAMQSSLASSDVSEHFWTTHSDHPAAAPSEYLTDDAGGSSLHSDYSDEVAEIAKGDVVATKPVIVEAQYAKQMEEKEPQQSVSEHLPSDKPLPLRVGSIGEVPTDEALITEQPQCRIGICEKLDDSPRQGGRNKAAVHRVQTKRMPDILRLEQRLVYAKQERESWPTHWANRYEWPRPKMDCAMRRVVRGVSEKAKVLPMVSFHFADITMNLKRASVSVLDVKFGFPETFLSKRPPLALARVTTVPAAPLTRVSIARAPVIRQALKPSKVAETADIKEPDARRKSTLAGRKEEKLVPEASKAEAAQADLSFEAQLEELRRKIKKGTSAFSEQVKDLSRGIAQATTSQKQAVQTEAAKSMKQEATQLAQQASDQWQQWKTNKEKKEAERLVLDKQATKVTASPAQQPPTSRRTSIANKVRLPQKVESPFFAKEKQNQAREMVSSSLPTVRKASTAGGGQAQAKSISKRPEPEGESDHENTETLSSKEAAPSKALCKIKEQPTVQVAKLESKPVKRVEMVEQGMASSAQVKGAKVRDEPTRSLTKQANYAQLVGVKKAPECLTARVEPRKGLAALQEPPFKWRKTKSKAKHRYNKQVCPIGDIDQLLNPKNRLRTFEQFEVFFSNCSKDTRRAGGISRKATSWPAKKIYAIDGLQDADTAFYSRTDLQRLFGLLSPTSKVPFKFDFSNGRKPVSHFAYLQ